MTKSQPPPVLQPPLPGEEAPAKRAAGLALAALILGICAFIPVLGLMCGLVGVTLGIVALAKKTSRKGMAAAGLALGGIGLFLNLVTVVFVVPVYFLSRGPFQRVKRLQCASNLRLICMGAAGYAAEKPRGLPPNLEVLVDEGTLPREALTCPVADSGRRCDYFYTPRERPYDAPPQTILICDLKDNHAGKGRNVCYVDGSVKWLSEAEFQRELTLPQNAKFAAALRAVE